MSRWGKRKKSKAKLATAAEPEQPQVQGPYAMPTPPLSVEGIEPARIVVATPCTDMVHAAYCYSLNFMTMRTMVSQDPRIGMFKVESFGTTILPMARKFLAEAALKCEATHILFIDSDMKFPSDMMLRLVQRDEAIVGINASTRRPPWRCTAQSAPGTPLITNEDSTGLEKVYRMGFGVAWIKMEVFKAIEPWFDTEFVPESGVYRGEDYYFCEKAKAAGFELYIDHDLTKEVKHVGLQEYDAVLTSKMTSGDFK